VRWTRRQTWWTVEFNNDATRVPLAFAQITGAWPFDVNQTKQEFAKRDFRIILKTTVTFGARTINLFQTPFEDPG
jgi:hypothetical protein